MVDEIHLLNSSLDPFLFSKDVLEVQFLFLRPEDGDVLQNQFFLSFIYEICIGLTHFFPPMASPSVPLLLKRIQVGSNFTLQEFPGFV